MTPRPTPSRSRTVRRVLVVACWASGAGAVLVFLLNVIVTHGVYGSRMAWLMGVVIPLLLATALMGWTASRLPLGAPSTPSAGRGDRATTASGPPNGQRLRGVAVTALALAVLPFVLLLAYGAALGFAVLVHLVGAAM